MPTMKYETPDVTRISFEDSLFATTKLDSWQNETVRKIVEKEGGVFKESVTKTTNYLIYGDGEEETTKYKKALELVRDKGLEITIIPWSAFRRLTTMTYITPDVTKIVFEGSTFVTTGLVESTNKEVEAYIESHGGIVKDSVTKTTNYLIYGDGEEETTKYKKALEMVRDKGLEITIIPWSAFRRLTTMTFITPGITKIEFEDSLFVLTDVGRDNTKDVQALIESRGGIVKSSVTRSTDYLIYGDGEEETTKYKKALELINEKGLEINVLPLSLFFAAGRGEGLIEFGTYPFEKDGTRGPIRWTVLKREGNKALLLSVYGLDAKRYNEKREDITWETCTLRRWLNEEFYESAFCAEEQQRIILTKVKNPDNPEYKTPGGNDTEDKVFLLSISEAKKHLPTAFERRMAPTPYAVKKGVSNWFNGNCWWWLRSPGYDPYDAARVDRGGAVDDDGHGVDYGIIAVCPALWVDLGSGIE